MEERCARQPAMLYPANAARNRALLRAETEAVLLLDVDFCPSKELASIVESPEGYAGMMAMLEARKAVVLPAFEPIDEEAEGKRLALAAVGSGKDFVSQEYRWGGQGRGAALGEAATANQAVWLCTVSPGRCGAGAVPVLGPQLVVRDEHHVLRLLVSCRQKRVIGFHTLHYQQGHSATDFERWMNSSQAYAINWIVGFEPYILMARKSVPFYDERFRGYCEWRQPAGALGSVLGIDSAGSTGHADEHICGAAGPRVVTTSGAALCSCRLEQGAAPDARAPPERLRVFCPPSRVCGARPPPQALHQVADAAFGPGAAAFSCVCACLPARLVMCLP